MRDHWQYLKYVLRHKWHVLYAGVKLGRIPLWQLLIHDASKFSRAEWLPYVRQFYNPDGTPRKVRDATGAYDPSVQSEAFKAAWANHWRKNAHHWNHYLNPESEDGTRDARPMPEVFVREMLADWYGASKAQGNGNDIEGWYIANRKNMTLHEDTAKMIGSVILEMWAKGIIESAKN